MLAIPDADARARLVAAIIDPESSPYPPVFELIVAEEDYTFKPNDPRGAEQLTVEVGDNGALIADMTLSGRESTAMLANAPFLLRAHIGGVPVPFAQGWLGLPAVYGTHTQVFGLSGAAFFDRVKLGSCLNLAPGETLKHTGSATRLVRKVVTAAQLHTAVKVEALVQEVAREEDDEGFAAEQSVADVLSAVAQEAEGVGRDTPTGVYEAFKDPGLGTLGDAVWMYETSEQTAFEHQAETQEMYSDVVVEKKPQPDATDANGDPAPKPGFRIRRRVEYPALPHSPRPFQTDWRVVSDEDRAQATRLAVDLATKHARQAETFSMTVTFNPLLQKYDAVLVGEDSYVRGGKWRVEWLAVLLALKWDARAMTTSLGGRMAVLSQTFTPDPPVRLGGVSPGVVLTPSGDTPLYPSDTLYPSDVLYPQG